VLDTFFFSTQQSFDGASSGASKREFFGADGNKGCHQKGKDNNRLVHHYLCRKFGLWSHSTERFMAVGSRKTNEVSVSEACRFMGCSNQTDAPTSVVYHY